jgi:hypothetical protein
MGYSFARFLDLSTELDYVDLIGAADRQYKLAEAASRRGQYSKTGRRQDSRQGRLREEAEQYARLVGGFLYWLRNFERDCALSDQEFMLFRPVCERLISRGQLLQHRLKVFDPVPATDPT